MTTYTLGWGWNDADPSGQNTITVTTPDEAADALDHIAELAAKDNCPRMVDVYEGTWRKGDPTPPYGMQLVWGHPERASLTWLGPDAGYATDPAVPERPEPIDHDQDEIGSHRTRLTPATVRSAVIGYVTTGERPTCVEWVN